MKCLKSKHITQGEYATGDTEDVMITTILGSCVSACLWDPVAGIGGMNHILLPDRALVEVSAQGRSINEMELLINEIFKQGGMKTRLKAKLFGGAQMISGFSDVGIRNAQFVHDFLNSEGIPCIGQSLGGKQARKIQFWPCTGRARQKFLGQMEFPVEQQNVQNENPVSDVELF